MKKMCSKALAVLICLALLICALPTSILGAFAVTGGELTVGVISDLHYYPRSLMGNDINKFIETSKLNSTTSYLTDALIDAALSEYEEQAKTRDLKYIFVPGDLSKNGEYEALSGLAEKFRAFEQRTGIQVLVINGNHDIRNHNAARFYDGNFVSTRYTEPQEFREIFADFGYDLADSFYTPPEGEQAGQLSYAATLEGGYRFIALDGGCYSSDNNSKGENKAETRGAYSQGLLNWALNEIKKADEQGLTVIGMTHFNLVEHFDHEDSTFTAFTIDNWQEVCESFADAGMHYAFTGHLHFQDIASWTSDNGETLTDCSTSSLINYPNYLRTVTFDNTAGNKAVTAKYEKYDVDNTVQISAYGKTYDKPFRYTSFALNYGGSDINDFANNFIAYKLDLELVPEIKKAGGLYNYLDNLLDFDSVIDSLLANTDISSIDGVGLTKSSIKAVLRTVLYQLQVKYIDDTTHTKEVVAGVVKKATSIELSDYPCTKYLDTLGFGDADRKGNLGDVVSSCLAYMYSADEDRTGDDFMNDVLARFERGDNAQLIFDTLVDIILNDLLQDEILPTLKIDPFTFIGGLTEERKDSIISSLLGGLFDGASDVNDIIPKLSAGDIVSVIFMLGITDYSSLEDILNSFLDEYMTKSQMDTIAYEFYNFIYDFTTDFLQPSDNNTTVSYNGKVAVTPTVKDLRLPSGIAVTLGNDSASSRNICWYTKVGVKGTDIEIVPYSSNPKFTGTPTTKGVKAETSRVTREYPGIDFGIFGILGYNFVVNRHTVSVTGLKAGTKYCYRVGDASRGWWSDVGVIETADNSDEFTFFHMSDSQGGIERQYDVWADTVKTAYGLYPDASFIMHTGDVVDSGTNFKQWNWVLNTVSDSLMDTALMPVTGNHEDEGGATVNNFMLPNMPSQNTDSGVYYSFDYNNAHFMVLNTNDLNDDGTLSADQLSWLRNDAASSDKDWKIVALHKAVYSNGSHYDDDDVVGLRAQLAVLMPELNIDLVLQGHDHVYLRTDAMNNNSEVESAETTVNLDGTSYNAKVKPEGTVYVIDGCSGVKYYQTKDVSLTDALFPRAEATYDANAPVFSAVRIKGGKLFFDAYTVQNGEAQKIDSFAIAKTLTAEEQAAVDKANGTADNNEQNTPTDVSVPKTSGIGGIKVVEFAVPVAAAAVITACLIKKKREKEI